MSIHYESPTLENYLEENGIEDLFSDLSKEYWDSMPLNTTFRKSYAESLITILKDHKRHVEDWEWEDPLPQDKVEELISFLKENKKAIDEEMQGWIVISDTGNEYVMHQGLVYKGQHGFLGKMKREGSYICDGVEAIEEEASQGNSDWLKKVLIKYGEIQEFKLPGSRRFSAPAAKTVTKKMKKAPTTMEECEGLFTCREDEFDEYVYISCLDRNLSEIIIPGTINGHPVIVENFSFRYMKYLKKLVIEEGVIEIGEDAFMHCHKLKEVVLPSSIEYIDENAFLDSPWRTSLTGDSDIFQKI